MCYLSGDWPLQQCHRLADCSKFCRFVAPGATLESLRSQFLRRSLVTATIMSPSLINQCSWLLASLHWIDCEALLSMAFRWHPLALGSMGLSCSPQSSLHDAWCFLSFRWQQVQSTVWQVRVVDWQSMREQRPTPGSMCQSTSFHSAMEPLYKGQSGLVASSSMPPWDHPCSYQINFRNPSSPTYAPRSPERRKLARCGTGGG